MAKEKEIKKQYTLFTVEVFFIEDWNDGEGGFGYNIYETIKQSRWWWFDKTIAPKKMTLSNLTESHVIKFLNASSKYQLLFEKGLTTVKGDKILNMYFDDIMFDILTELK